jgi:hypothetical protein
MRRLSLAGFPDPPAANAVKPGSAASRVASSNTPLRIAHLLAAFDPTLSFLLICRNLFTASWTSSTRRETMGERVGTDVVSPVRGCLRCLNNEVNKLLFRGAMAIA